MFFRFVLLAICLGLTFFVSDFIVPKIKLKYRLYKEFKEKKKRQTAFKNKMKELEIK